MEWRTISVALQVDSAGYIRGVKQAADATKDFGQTVEKTASDGVWDRFRTKSNEAFGAVWKWTKRFASGALLGGLYKTLTGGWQRFTTIEDATAALTVSLGDATKAADLLDDVLGVVSGTPFNLDQFASAAQLMAGMGVAANKIPGYLEAIGEAAATQGGRAGEMAERLSTIFGEIQSRGNITTQHINRISQTGVNALVILANEYGVTTQEMQKMVTKGMVPAERAMDALSEGIINGSQGAAGETRALGGTMETLRDTLSGSAGGLNAALARFGASMIEAFSPGLVSAMNTVTDVLDELGGILQPLFRVMGAGLKVFADTEWAVRGLVIALGGLAAVKVASVVVGFVDAVGKFAGGAFNSARSAIDDFRLGLQGLTEQGAGASNALGGLMNTMRSSPAALGAVGGAVAVLGFAWLDYQQAAKKAKQETQELIAATKESGDVAEVFGKKLAATWSGVDGGFDINVSADTFRAMVKDAGFSLRELNDALTGSDEGWTAFMNAVGKGGGGLATMIPVLRRWRGSFVDSGAAIETNSGALSELGIEAEGATGILASTAEKVWEMAQRFGVSREQFVRWVESMGGVRSATSEVESSISGLPPQVESMAEAFEELGEAIDSSVEKLAAWAGLYDTIVGVPKAWEDAQREWIGTLDDLGKAFEESGGNIDINTEAGRKNLAMVSDAIDELPRAAEAYGANGDGAEDAAAALAWMREELIQTLEKQLKSREAAEKLVNQYGLTEEALWLLSEAAKDGGLTADQLAGVMQYLAEKGGEAEVAVDKAGNAIIRLPSGKTVTVDVLVQRQALDRVMNDIRSKSAQTMHVNVVSTGMIFGRWGGVTKYAKGGIHQMGLNHRMTAQIGSGRNQIWWDEPETGGEAYIPRLGSKQRSTEVLSTAASWYGMRVVPMASGGVYQSEVTRAPYRPWVGAGSGGNVTHFNGGVHISEDALGVTSTEAAEIARQVFQDGMRGLR